MGHGHFSSGLRPLVWNVCFCSALRVVVWKHIRMWCVRNLFGLVSCKPIDRFQIFHSFFSFFLLFSTKSKNILSEKKKFWKTYNRKNEKAKLRNITVSYYRQYCTWRDQHCHEHGWGDPKTYTLMKYNWIFHCFVKKIPHCWSKTTTRRFPTWVPLAVFLRTIDFYVVKHD